VEALLKDEPEVLALWRKAITGKPGAHHNNIMSSKQGTSRAYTLDRLKRECVPYSEKFVQANYLPSAAIAAGFRKKPVKRCPKCGHEW
jgi:hypothetical protein